MSYDIFFQYTYSLTGDYYQLAVKLDTLNKDLTNDESIHWYYSQIKLYAADLELMQGKFYNAFRTIDDMEKIIDDSIFSFYIFFNCNGQGDTYIDLMAYGKMHLMNIIKY